MRAKVRLALFRISEAGSVGVTGLLFHYVDMYAKASGSLYAAIPFTEALGPASGRFSSQPELSGRGFRTFNKVDIDILNKATYSV